MIFPIRYISVVDSKQMGRIKGVKTGPHKNKNSRKNPNKVSDIEEDKFRHVLENSKSFTDAAIKLGYSSCGGPFIPQIKERAGELGIDIEHINGLKSNLDMKSGRRTAPTLRNQLKRAKRPYICENCDCKSMTMGDNGEWQWEGRDLALEINHRYGVGFEGCDHPAMLQYLCSPCHRQHTNIRIWAQSGLRGKFTTGSSD